MKLERVELVLSTYDPATGKSGVHGSRKEFAASDGYEMSLSDGVVSIRHPATPLIALYPFERCVFALADAQRLPEPLSDEAPVEAQAEQKESVMGNFKRRRR